MDLYLQFGHGMMEHTRHLLTEWGGGTVVLSPRDLTAQQLTRLAGQVRALPGGVVLLDPQFYLPHADHERLRTHDYWPADYQTGAFWDGPPLATLISRLLALNRALGASAFILPGILAGAADDDWLETQRATLEEAQAQDSELPLIQTIALGADASRNTAQMGALLERTAGWTPAGYYVVCEHPAGRYLSDDPIWLSNVLDLLAGLRLRGARVIVGYCNQQMLLASTTRATAICSGTWMNVRSFPPDKFQSPDEDENRQRSTWYYCPQALSEYQIPFLDFAHAQGVLAAMLPGPGISTSYVAPLFAGAQPSSMQFTEQAAFRHYLTSLRHQAISAEKDTFDATVTSHRDLLDQAQALLRRLAAAGVRAQGRSFEDILDVNRAGLVRLSDTRGPILRRKWSAL
jgi:hypothetical protein